MDWRELQRLPATVFHGVLLFAVRSRLRQLPVLLPILYECQQLFGECNCGLWQLQHHVHLFVS